MDSREELDEAYRRDGVEASILLVKVCSVGAVVMVAALVAWLMLK